MRKVLVTGAAGFIGRQCLPLLIEKGYEVHAVDLKVLEGRKKDEYWHKVDLLDCGQLSRLISKVHPDILLHFAWYAVPGRYWTSLENFRWVSASLELLKEFYTRGGSRAVRAGTCAEYDWKHEKCSEFMTPLEPATIYGVCKRSLCAMLDSFSKETGLSNAWGRIFFLYGPYEHPDRLVPFVISSLLQGKPCELSHGKQVRDFLYVEDVASAFVALLESDIRGPVNIGSGTPISIEELVNMIGEKLGRLDLIRFGEKDVPKPEPMRLEADVRRLNEEVGWSARYGVDKGIDRTIRWWKDYLKKG